MFNARSVLTNRTPRSIATIIVGSLLLGGVVSSFDASRAHAVTAAETVLSRAIAKVDKAQKVAAGRIEEANAHIATAQAALDASAGKVLTEDSRTALGDAIRRTNSAVGVASAEIVLTERAVKAAGSEHGLFADSYGRSAESLAPYDFVAAKKLPAAGDGLTVSVQMVTDATAAWQAEQERIAAEQAAAAAAEAARVAAAEAVAAEAAKAPAYRSAPSRPSSSGQASAQRAAYTKNVWTSGYQAELDACNGAVDLTGKYRVPTIGEHWSCGGQNFPTSAGTIVQLTGIRAGTYRVEGVAAVLNIATDASGEIPRGYDLMYQTCINGSSAAMSFTALTRIG